MHVVFTDRALTDLDALRTYISQDNPTAARKQIERIFSRIASLSSHPLLGRSGRVGETRELVITGTRYIVVYTVDSEAVRILAVIHGSMMWPKKI